MKKTMRQSASALIAVALFVTGLVLAPAMNASAADVSFLANSKMELVDGSGNTNLSKVMFWKGQDVSFSVSVGKESAMPTWTVEKNGVVTSDITLKGSAQSVTETASKTVTQTFSISDAAAGEYKIVASGNGDKREYTLEVQEKLISTFVHGYTGDETYMDDLWTGTELTVYVVTKKGQNLTSKVSGSSLVKMAPKTIASASLPYYGEGSEIHEYTVSIGDTIADTVSQEDDATLTVTNAAGESQSIDMYFKQSAKSFRIESVVCHYCGDAEHALQGVTHYDADTKTLRLDQGQTVTITVVCEGSHVENPSVTTDNPQYFTEVKPSILKAVGGTVTSSVEDNTTTYTVTYRANSSTANYERSTGKALYAHVNMGSGKTERFGVRIYSAGFVNSGTFVVNNKIGSGNVISNIKSMNLYAGQTGQLTDTVTAADPQEKVKYEYVSGSKDCFSINEDTGAYQANNITGSAIYRAVVQETKSGIRGQSVEIQVNVTAYSKPEKISLVEGTSLETGSAAEPSKVLYVGDPNSTIKYFVKEEGGNAPYNLSYNWKLSANDIVKCAAQDDGKWATVTPAKKGTVTLKVQSNEDTNLYASSVSYTVFAPIKEISLKADNEAVVDNSMFKVQQRKVTLSATRDADASPNEKLVWTTSDATKVRFIVDGKPAETATGNTCVIETVEPGSAKVTVKADGFGLNSKASNFINIDVQKREPADNIVFRDNNGDEIISYSEEAPYEITLIRDQYNRIQNSEISFTGYANNGAYTTDIFTVKSMNEAIAKLSYSDANAPMNQIVVTPVKAGKVLFEVKNEITGDVIELWVRIRNERSMVEATIDPIEDAVYTGTAQTPTVVVRDVKGNELVAGKDYNVSYSPYSLVDAGTYVVTVRGIGQYMDELTTTYKILPADISDVSVVVNNGWDIVYNGNAQTPPVAVTLGTVGVHPSNYTVKYSNNKSAGTGKITLTGTQNFKGTKTVKFKILPKNINNVSVTLEYGYVTYTGSALKPVVTVTDPGRANKVLKKGTDYSVTYKNNTKVGTASVTVKGLGNYGESKVLTFNITARTITLDDITLSKVDYDYNGKTCKPTVTVKNGSLTMKKDRDYTITYPTDMKSIGIKTIVIAGKGNYAGTVYPQYYVAEKVSVKTPSVKSVKNSSTKTLTVTLGKMSDVAGYEVTYSTSKDFSKATTSVVTSEKNVIKLTKLTKGKYYYVKCRAYKKNSLNRNAYSSYTSVKKVKVAK